MSGEFIKITGFNVMNTANYIPFYENDLFHLSSTNIQLSFYLMRMSHILIISCPTKSKHFKI